MNTSSSTEHAAALASTLIWQRTAAVVLGTFIIGFVGLSHIEAAHNAGHDYRHSIGLPCH